MLPPVRPEIAITKWCAPLQVTWNLDLLELLGATGSDKNTWLAHGVVWKQVCGKGSESVGRRANQWGNAWVVESSREHLLSTCYG